MTTGAAAIGTMIGPVMMKETIPDTTEGSGTVKIKREVGSAAETETGTATAAVGMTVMMAMIDTAGEVVQHALQLALVHVDHPKQLLAERSVHCVCLYSW